MDIGQKRRKMPRWAVRHSEKTGLALIFFPAEIVSTLKYVSIPAVSSHFCKKKSATAKLQKHLKIRLF